MWDLVIEEMKARDKVGRERYGGPVQICNGRDSLQDQIAELLDAVVYSKQLQQELLKLGNKLRTLRRSLFTKAETDSYTINIYDLTDELSDIISDFPFLGSSQ